MTQPAVMDKEKRLALAVGALGVVYGDIGTSPLYALREAFSQGGLDLTQHHVLGVLSLVVWSLILVVTCKYVLFILRADNRGEGGMLALMTLAQDPFGHPRLQKLILFLGLLGASLFYGDALVTPAISVLGAVEGLKVMSPAFETWVMPLSLAIIVGLFAVQRQGTAVVGRWFGPVCVLWFGVMGVLGLGQIWQEPMILKAFFPWEGLMFLLHEPVRAFFVAGAVVLVLTGAEALYADMGHFGRQPIQRAWLAVVLPSLLLNYLGQGALLLRVPAALENPFFYMAPAGLELPLVLLATAATVIASQAVISGAFSMTQQAMQLGYLPRFEVRHTAADAMGQIYMPQLNGLMAVLVVLLMLGFGSSSNLAAAYGVAVTGTMLISSILATGVLHKRLNWPLALAALFGAVFVASDSFLLSATLMKVPHGGWFPLVLGGSLLGLMWTWIGGREVTGAQVLRKTGHLDVFLKNLPPELCRPEKPAVYLTGDLNHTPLALLANVMHNHVLHRPTVMLKVTRARVPRVAERERIRVRNLGDDISTVELTYGFMEEPHIPHALRDAQEHGLDMPQVSKATYYLSNHKYLPKRGHGLNWVQEPLFMLMEHFSVSAAGHFHLPKTQTLELSDRIEI